MAAKSQSRVLGKSESPKSMAAKSQSSVMGKSKSQKSMAAKSQSRMLGKSKSQKIEVGKSESQELVMAQKGKAPSRFQTCIASEALKEFTVFLTILLVSGAAAMCALCYYKEGELTKLHQGVAQLRTFLASQNASYANESDPAIVLEALHLSENLIETKRSIVEISKELDRLIKLMDEGWESYKGQLYLLASQKMSFEMAMKNCELQKSAMVTLMSRETELFIEYRAQYRKKHFWIGLWYVTNRWEWINGQELSGSSSTFWARGEPKTQRNGTCVEIRPTCSSKHACWYTADCSQTKEWVCEIKPNPKYMD